MSRQVFYWCDLKTFFEDCQALTKAINAHGNLMRHDDGARQDRPLVALNRNNEASIETHVDAAIAKYALQFLQEHLEPGQILGISFCCFWIEHICFQL